MKFCQDVAVASLLIAYPVCAFIPSVPRQTALMHKDISYSSLMIQQLHSSSPMHTSLFAGATDGSSTATDESGKEIDLLNEADAIFDSVDTNNDGQITADELRAHLVDQMGYTVEYTKYLFASLDTDADGVITRDEMKFAFYNFEALSMYMTFGVGGSDITSREAFKAFALNQAEGGSDKLLLNDLADLIFDMIDTDNSGEITKEELRGHFDNVTSKFDDEKSTDMQAKDYVETMFATFDKNNDGGIDRAEVRVAFQKYDFKLLAKTFGLRVYRTAEV